MTFSQRNAVNASSGWVGWLGMAGVFGRGCPEAQCPRCPLSTTYQVVLQSKRSLRYFKTFQVSRQRINVFCVSEELLVRQSFMKETQNKTPPWERRSGLGHNASHGSFYCWPPSRFEINISSFTNEKYV